MIRLGVIGCGKVVEAFHLPALKRVGGIELAAVIDADQSRAQSMATFAGARGVHVGRDVREILGRCDAALVALPNYLHAGVCESLLAGGCHVLVEKPMATSVAECDRLILAARDSGAVLAVAMVRRFIPAYELVRELVTSVAFGSVRGVRVREGVVYNWPATTGFFLKREQAGGGVLVDYGSHVLDALLWWLGPLTLESYSDDAHGGVEAECHVRLASSDGTPIDVELSRLRRLSCTARIEWERATLEINLHSGAADLMIGEGLHPIRGRVGVSQGGSWAEGVDPFVRQLRAFARDVERGAGVTPTARAARDVAVLFESCASRKRPLEGPATPAVDSLTVGMA